ncbi:MAG TPA: hypothetical protein PK911_05265, partial [Candidatus Saccharibacteria bacterium]|nr:hypothetical protein [Candidatus Saccharibacteria bacterium]
MSGRQIGVSKRRFRGPQWIDGLPSCPLPSQHTAADVGVVVAIVVVAPGSAEAPVVCLASGGDHAFAIGPVVAGP